ncbi:MAG TPA: GAF domain-containing protein [Symbiobacteriaceae bacterium]|nr:GAF domain-containing protein [Symbiobacteriaceae bacterium]
MASRSRKQGATQPTAKKPLAFYVATILFMLSIGAWITSALGIASHIPGFDSVVVATQGFAQNHFGFSVLLCVLLGIALAFGFSGVAEISVAGLKVRNPLHLAASDTERREFEQHRRNWDQERKRLLVRSIAAEAQVKDMQTITQENHALRTELDEAVRKTSIIDYALNTCSHQDSIFEELFDAFAKDEHAFTHVYHGVMGWLAHLTKQLVIAQDRSLHCTIISYDSNNDTSHIIGEVGTKLNRSDQFLPKRGVGIAGRVIVTGRPEVVNNVAQDRDYIPFATDNPGSMICIPVHHRRQIVGIVSVCSRRINAFSTQDLETTQLAVDNIAVAMSLRRLKLMDARQHTLSRKLDDFLSRPPDKTEGGEGT